MLVQVAGTLRLARPLTEEPAEIKIIQYTYGVVAPDEPDGKSTEAEQ
jgi:hypothetical protein